MVDGRRMPVNKQPNKIETKCRHLHALAARSGADGPAIGAGASAILTSSARARSLPLSFAPRTLTASLAGGV
jgi:hypothetical protein